MRLLPYLFLAPLLLPACAPKQVPGKNAAATTATNVPVLIFKRTPCFGLCPAYTDSVFADGRVQYEGVRGVPLLGRHTLRLPPATVADMLAEARHMGFSKLNDTYSRNTSDLPATVLIVQPPGQPRKAVLAAEDIPDKLQAYIDYLKRQLDPLAGLGVEK